MNPRIFQSIAFIPQNKSTGRSTRPLAALLLLLGAPLFIQDALAQTPSVPVITINAANVTAHVSPMLYGLMTEEINYSYDGGLYGELIRNRTFKDTSSALHYWHLVQDDGASNSMEVVTDQPLNDALTNSLKLEITTATAQHPVGLANDGFWGIPVRPSTRYQASFYARAAAGFTGPLRVAIVGTDSNATVYASGKVSKIGADWKKYSVTLTTGNVPTTKDARLVISAAKPGTIWLDVVSLFPPTYNHRPNGNRQDIMQLLADMKPSFLRFPGGNYLEGNTFATRFNWKKTLHDVSKRPGHNDDGWRYWSVDGMGLLEFLEWCEDLHMDPVLAIYAGYSMREGGVPAGPDLDPYVKEGLEEIEYVTGDKNTPWGAQRAADGHPKPFKLEFVEIGNEDNLGTAPRTYDGRYAAFYDAIKAKYPALKVIATARVTSRTPDVIDNHYYSNSEMDMESHAHDYDINSPRGSRTGPKVFEGEWATRAGRPTPSMAGALGDAAFMTGLERNSDLVIMASYAPLFVNVNPGGMQWPTDLIGYDTLTSYGSPAYYAQLMFNRNHGDQVLAATAEKIPTREWLRPARGGRRGGDGATTTTNASGVVVTNAAPTPAPVQLSTVFFDATRHSKTKAIYLKVVNSIGTPQAIHVEITGVAGVKPNGQAIVLSASSPEDTNSIKEPNKIIPVTSQETGLGASFTRTFPPYSITVLVLQGT